MVSAVYCRVIMCSAHGFAMSLWCELRATQPGCILYIFINLACGTSDLSSSCRRCRTS